MKNVFKNFIERWRVRVATEVKYIERSKITLDESIIYFWNVVFDNLDIWYQRLLD